MTDRPILFSAPMVRAIIDGSKTQTRRIVQPPDGSDWSRTEYHHEWGWRLGLAKFDVWEPIKVRFSVGDRLWVRETHCFGTYGPEQALRRKKKGQDPTVFETERKKMKQYEHFKWRPSIHMPRWASRITLTVTDVRVQKLHGIDEADAAAEGIVTITRSVTLHGRMDGYGIAGTSPEDASSTRVNAYARLWDQINGRDAWKKNPWIIAVTFKPELRNIDQ